VDTNIQISPLIQHDLIQMERDRALLRRHMQRPAALHFKIQIAASQFLATVD